MRFQAILVVAILATASPAAATTATCQDVYYKCLNDTWDTTGLARIAADLECAARYAGCIRRTIA